MVPQVVGRPVLVEYPENFAWVRHEICREFQSDHPVDPHALTFGQVKHPACQRLLHDALRGIPFKWDCNEICLVSRLPECVTQLLRVDLGATADERRMGGCNYDSHRSSSWVPP